MKASKAVALGDSAKDVISGYTGIVTGRAEYLTGCTQFVLSATKLDKDGKVPPAEWFDESRLAVVKKGAVKLPGAVASPGGPQTSAPRGRK